MKTKIICTIALACVALIAAGCKVKTGGHSTVTATVGNRSIAADADGPLWVQPDQENFLVKVARHDIVIEKERLLVDKVERAKIPVAATNFVVVCTNGTLTVTADGAEILQTPLTK